jgi:hypothetical protein
MTTLAINFMKTVLGEDGQQAFNTMSKRAPSLGALLAPRTIIGWLKTASTINYEGEIPGVGESFIALNKNEAGIDAHINIMGAQKTFDGVDILDVAAVLSYALGVGEIDIDPELKSTDISKLGKSIDMLVKARTISYVSGVELQKFALTPTKMTQHGGLHVVHTPGQTMPYSIHDSSTGSAVSETRFASLKHAQTIANWHANRPIAKSDAPGIPAAARAPEEQQQPLAPQKAPPMRKPPTAPIQKSTREIFVKNEDAGHRCRACGLPQFKSQKFTGCMCFRALAKSVDTKLTHEGFVINLHKSQWDDDTVQTLILAMRG